MIFHTAWSEHSQCVLQTPPLPHLRNIPQILFVVIFNLIVCVPIMQCPLRASEMCETSIREKHIIFLLKSIYYWLHYRKISLQDAKVITTDWRYPEICVVVPSLESSSVLQFGLLSHLVKRLTQLRTIFEFRFDCCLTIREYVHPNLHPNCTYQSYCYFHDS